MQEACNRVNAITWIKELEDCKGKGMTLFTIPELMNLSGQDYATTRRTIVRLKDKGILRPIYRGIWGYGSDVTLEGLFLKTDPDSYVSLETVLGRSNAMKSLSPDLHCVSLRKSRAIQTQIGTIIFHRIKRDLFFGFDSRHFASPEKALLDYIYIKMKSGKKILPKELDLSSMHKQRLRAIAKPYPQFVKNSLEKLL